MTPYLITYTFYYDGELLSKRCFTKLCEEPREEEYSGTDFEGLWDLTSQWSALIPFNMWEFKKGKRFLQYYDWLFKKVTPKNCKRWEFIITSQKTTITMNELMNYDSETAIKYLKERGMTACPILK